MNCLKINATELLKSRWSVEGGENATIFFEVKNMKKVLLVLLIVFALSFYGCDEFEIEQNEVEDSQKENSVAESDKKEDNSFGLTEKELERIEYVLKHGTVPYTLDDVESIIFLGYDKIVDQNGKLVEAEHLLEYEVILKNGERQLITVNKYW